MAVEAYGAEVVMARALAIKLAVAIRDVQALDVGVLQKHDVGSKNGMGSDGFEERQHARQNAQQMLHNVPKFVSG